MGEARGLHSPPPPSPDTLELLGGGGPRRPGRVHRRLPGRGWLCGNPGDSAHPVLSPGGSGAQAGGPGEPPAPPRGHLPARARPAKPLQAWGGWGEGGCRRELRPLGGGRAHRDLTAARRSPGAWACAGAAGAGAPPDGGAAPAGGPAGAERTGLGALPGRGVRAAALLTGPKPVTFPAPPGERPLGPHAASFPLPARSWSLAQGRQVEEGASPPLLPPAAPPTSCPLPVPGCAWPSLSRPGGAGLSKPGGFCTPNAPGSG